MKNTASKNTSMTKWLCLHSVIILLVALSATLFVEIIAVQNGDYLNAFLKSIGIVIPMCALLTVYNIFMFRSAYKKNNIMNRSIEKIANGDFTVRLDPKGAKSMEDVFENINIMAQELENTAMMKSDFINNYSHEFKTPISSINGFAELLLTENVTEDERKMYLNVIFDESKRLAELTDKTILLSKLDNQSIVENKKKYNLDEQLKKTCIALSRVWTQKNINFSGEIEKATYYGNEELLKQLWLNLFSNAIKFTPNGGEIFVTLAHVDDKIKVSVRDNGKGMNAEQVARIFDKYYQADNSTQSGGLGLGLSIAKRIVELCGGELTVESKLNEGSCFTVVL